ncbi:hypothetical protein AB0J86_02910 [Micromonospora sp. NPDC049559]|uniref:hypothetical protein n=1 Tax=Micromonospora sp. NPDC049559 TaxID=3155923 RepID=UPI00344345DA
MLRAPRSTTAAARLGAGLLLAGVPLLAACGTPPELREAQAHPSATRSVTSAPTTAAPVPTLAPTFPLPGQTSTAPDEIATDCQGRPSAAQVIALLRRADVVPAQAQASVSTGPLCAEEWQYTVVQVPKRDPLQVVSKGSPGSLKLVTAGTDVCNIPVRVEAPPGILSRACAAAEGTTGTLPGFGA